MGKIELWILDKRHPKRFAETFFYFICASKTDVPLAQSTEVDSVSYSNLSPYSPSNLVQKKGEIKKAKFCPLNLHFQRSLNISSAFSALSFCQRKKCSSWGKEGEKQNKVILAFMRPANSLFFIALKWEENTGFQP